MRTVQTNRAPMPAGHYSQAKIYNNTVYVSGQLPIDPRTGEKCLGTIEEQTRQALANMAAILEAAGSDRAHVLKTTVYVANIALWDRVDAAYRDFFGDHRRARAVVPTRDLHYGFQVEIDAIAVTRQESPLG